MHQTYQTITWIIMLWPPPSNTPQFLKDWRNQQTFTQSGRPLKDSSLNVTISPTAADTEAPQQDSTTSEHMLEPDREAVVPCTNGYVSTVMHVSIPKTRIRRVPEALPATREEGDITQFCAETLTSETQTRTWWWFMCARMDTRAHEPQSLDNFAAFFSDPSFTQKMISHFL